MPRNVVADGAVVEGGGRGVGDRCDGVIAAAVAVVVVVAAGRDGLAVLSVVDEVDGLAADRKLN